MKYPWLLEIGTLRNKNLTSVDISWSHPVNAPLKSEIPDGFESGISPDSPYQSLYRATY